MKIGPARIEHVDLADGPRAIPADGQPHLLVFWWRSLPLGARALLAAELPFDREQMVQMAAELIADQVAARTERLEGAWRAGVDARPHSRLRRSDALAAEGLLARLDGLSQAPPIGAEQLAVIVCTTCERAVTLEACLERLERQQARPGQIIIVDNSADGRARSVCQGRPLTYVHEPRRGLSIARNAGLAAATRELVAFTDDDVEVAQSWTAEIVRGFADPRVDAVTGLVLPARLETPAQWAFEVELGGFTARYAPLVFDSGFLDETRTMGPQVWRIGAGANMAFRRELFARLGGFDERLGAGASGCSEDSEYWYRVLAAGGLCLYEPRAVVFHHHRADWRALRAQYRAYMKGHVAALVGQADRYGDAGNIRRIFRQLPAYFARTAGLSIQNSRWWRLRLLGEEVIGWILGLQFLLRPRWRRRGRKVAQGLQPGRPAAAAAGSVRHA